jgi:hypothetical protein
MMITFAEAKGIVRAGEEAAESDDCPHVSASLERYRDAWAILAHIGHPLTFHYEA